MSSYRLAAEWETQDAVLLAWPHDGSDWASQLDAVEAVYMDLVDALVEAEKVLIVYRDRLHREHIEKRLVERLGENLASQQIRYYQSPTDDTWTRDYGPITLVNSDESTPPRLIDFTFNGWGNKFNAERDNQVTARLHGQSAFSNSELQSFDFVLEGGSIDSDGAGTILTTKTCLLSPERNPTLDQGSIEAVLRSQLHADRILWLEHGELIGDDTDAHIDTLARFCDTNTIAYVQCESPDDEHYDALQKMQTELEQLRNREGTPYELVALPMPSAKHDNEGQRLPATYANFLIANELVLVPTYGDPADAIAIERLQRCFPTRRVTGINCLPLIEQHGSLHCITMQLPQGTRNAIEAKPGAEFYP